MKTFDRVVVGGGLSGLLAAWRAANRGETVAVLEGGASLGGLIESRALGGHSFDIGAESFSVAGESALSLVRELGLETSVVWPAKADPQIIFEQGEHYSIPKGILGIPEDLSDPLLAEIFSEDELAEARRLDALEPIDYSGFTIAQLVDQRLGRAFAQRLVDPTVSGVHGTSAKVLDAKTTMPKVVELLETAGSLSEAVRLVRGKAKSPGSAVASLSGGMRTLIDSLTSRLAGSGVSVFGNSAVSVITRRAGNWVVETTSGEFQASAVSLAIGADQLKELLERSGFELPEQFAQLATDTMVALALVRSASLNDYPLGSGALVSANAGITAKASTHVNAKWQWVQDSLGENQHVVRLSFGRDGVFPQAIDEQFIAEQIRQIYSVNDVEVEEFELKEWKSSLFRSSASSLAMVKAFRQIANSTGLEIVGSFASGNGILGITKDHYERTKVDN